MSIDDDIAYLIITNGNGIFDGIILKDKQIIGDITDKNGGGTYSPLPFNFEGKQCYRDSSLAPRTIPQEIQDMQQDIQMFSDVLEEVEYCETMLRGLAEYQQMLKAPIQEFEPPKPEKGDGKMPPTSYGRG